MSGTGSQKVQYQTMHTTNIPASGYQIGQEIADGRWYEGRTTPAKYPRLLLMIAVIPVIVPCGKPIKLSLKSVISNWDIRYRKMG